MIADIVNYIAEKWFGYERKYEFEGKMYSKEEWLKQDHNWGLPIYSPEWVRKYKGQKAVDELNEKINNYKPGV